FVTGSLRHLIESLRGTPRTLATSREPIECVGHDPAIGIDHYDDFWRIRLQVLHAMMECESLTEALRIVSLDHFRSSGASDRCSVVTAVVGNNENTISRP